MKKFYSLLLLTLVAALGFTAQAQKTVTFKFSDPNAVEKITGDYGSNTFTVDSNGEIVFTQTATYDNPALYLNPGNEVESIVDTTSGYTFNDQNDYYFSEYAGNYTLYIGYNDEIHDNDVILITTKGAGGSGGDEPNDDWAYTIICPEEGVNVGSYTGLTVSAYTDGAYTITGMSSNPTANFYINGENITEVSANGDVISTQYAGYYTINVADYPESTTFFVEVKETPKEYTFNCAVDALSFTGDGAITTTYANGAYTVTGFNTGVSAEVKNTQAYSIKSLTVPAIPSAAPYFTSTGFYVATYSYASGTVFNVELDAKTLIYTINVDADVLQFAGSSSTMTVGAYNESEKSYTISGLVVGDVLSASLSADAVSSGITIKDVAPATGTNTVTVIDGQRFTLNTTDFNSSTSFAVTLDGYTPGGGEEEGDGNTITFTVEDQNYINASYQGKYFTFTDNKLVFDRDTNGNLITFAPANGATLLNFSPSTGINTISGGAYQQTWTVSVADVPAGTTVAIGLVIPQPRNFTFTGIEGLSVKFNGQEAEYANNTYTISNVANNYGSVMVSVPEALASTVELLGVTPDGGDMITPDGGIVYIAEYEFPQSTHFTINTKELTGPAETITTTFTIENGFGYLMDMWNVTTGAQIEIYTNNPTEVSFSKGDGIFIGLTNGDDLALLKVDGVDVPSSLCDVQDSFYNKYGYLLTEDCGYYPTNGGSVQIYQEAPDATAPKLTFTFTNEGTEGYLKDLKIGSTFLRDEEFDDAIANGVEVTSGSNLDMVFNTTDYTVTEMTVNGVAFQGDSYSTTVTEDLAFVFNVTASGGNIVTINSDGWEHLNVSDPDRNTYTLTSASTELTLASTVERLFITAKDGWEIPEKGITVVGGVENGEYNQGDGLFVKNGTIINVTVNATQTPDQKVFYFNCTEDVLEFTGYPTDPTATYSNGQYTVSNMATSVYAGVKPEFQADYVLAYFEYSGQQITVANGVSTSIPVTQIPSGAVFNTVFKADVQPRNITIEVNNPSCIKRIYSANSGNITAFPAVYDLNNGTSFTVELMPNCTLNSVTWNGEDLLTGTDTFSVESVPEDGVVLIDVTADTGDFTYTFTAPEGVGIVYNGIKAPFVDGLYIVSNVFASTLGTYPVEISVEAGYENSIVLVNATDGYTTWEYSPSNNQILIPGSELPRANTDFQVNTRKPEASETTRKVYLTIDNIEVVSYVLWNANYGGFDSGEDGKGVRELVVTPTLYEVTIVTTKNVTAITTDVEGTFTMPALPSSSVTLNLSNAVEGQTINLLTAESGIFNVFADENGDVEVYNLQGIKVTNTTNLAPGIYIVNGKKVLVR